MSPFNKALRIRLGIFRLFFWKRRNCTISVQRRKENIRHKNLDLLGYTRVTLSIDLECA